MKEWTSWSAGITLLEGRQAELTGVKAWWGVEAGELISYVEGEAASSLSALLNVG